MRAVGFENVAPKGMWVQSGGLNFLANTICMLPRNTSTVSYRTEKLSRFILPSVVVKNLIVVVRTAVIVLGMKT